MPTWAEVKDFARKKYKIAEEREDSFKLVFEYDNKRLQTVIVSRFEAMGREFCDFSSACCQLHQLDPRDALKQSFGFALGALVLDRDVYVVRHSCPMDALNLEEFDLPLHVVASSAARIEREAGTSSEPL